MHKVTLKDWQGQPHVYEITLFGVDEGMKLMFELGGVLGGPLGALLKSGIGAFVTEDRKLSDVLDTDVAALVKDVDFAAVGKELAAHLAQAQKSLDLVKRLLELTFRDGQRVVEPTVWGQAYQGNYFEALQACVEVVKVNRLFPLPATS